MELNQLSSNIIKAAIHIHKELGPGLLESVYQSCMVIELNHMGLVVEAEKACPIVYREKEITDQGFRLDLLVEDTVIVELRAPERIKSTILLVFLPVFCVASEGTTNEVAPSAAP